MKKFLSLLLTMLIVLSALPLVMASADVVLPEVYGDDDAFATLVSGKASVTLDKDYVLTEPVSTVLTNLTTNAYTITYNPSAGNEDATAITTTKSSLIVTVDSAKSDYEDVCGTFKNYGNGYFFKVSNLQLKGNGSYGDGTVYGDLKVDGNLKIDANTANIYGNVVCSKKITTTGAKVIFHGNVDTKDFAVDRPVEFKGYFHATGNDVNFGICNPYAGYCIVPYFNGTNTYNGYTIYCEGNVTYNFDSEKINLLTDNGRNINTKDMYVGGDLNVTWFGHTELGFTGKVTVGGNVKVTNYKTKSSTSHPDVTTPKNITLANLVCEGQSLQLTENYYNEDAEDVVTIYSSGDAITVTPYAVLENVVVVKIDGENVFVGKKGDTTTLPEASQTIIGYSDGQTLYQPNDEITVDKDIEFTTILRSIEEADFEINLEDKTYSGSEITTGISSLTGLEEGVDYWIYYENNLNVGTATVTISGLGHYVGSFSKTFNVVKKSILADDFSLEQNSLVYSGESSEPEVLSSISNDNYDVEYKDNLNVGTATVIITGKNNCEGVVELEFAITPKAITEENFTVDTQAKIYTGEEITTDIESDLVKDEDYTVEYADNTNVGEATVTVSGIGNYFGEINYNFNIAQKEITEDDFIVDTLAKIYSGEEITTDIESNLVKDEDYTVEYADNTNVGQGTVTVRGIGNYCGEIAYKFNITPKEITENDFVVDTEVKIYTGKEIKAEIKSNLVSDKDYAVEYENNVNVGIATVTIKGIGNYFGEIQVTFNIAQREIVKEDFSLENESVLYTGEALEPKIVTNIGEENYEVVYSNNINEGIATVTITGKNNCKGEVVLTFKIVREFTDDLFSLEETDFVYSGEAFEPEVISNIDAENYEVVYTNNVKVGEATVTITATGENYKGSVTLTFTIAAKEINENMFSLPQIEKVYTGEKIVTEVVSDLVYNEDYTVEYADNINVGEATVTVIGIGNYCGEIAYNFNITPKAITEQDFTVNISDQEFTGKELTTIVTSILEKTDYKVEYENNVNVGIATVKITGIGNYKEELVYNFNITQKTISDKDFTVDTTAKIYTSSDVETEIESNLEKDVDYTVEYLNNVNVGKATILVTGIGNYQGQTFFEFDILAKAISEEDFAIDKTLVEYTGKAYMPEVATELIKDVDYILTYLNNKNVGTATVVITGKGNYIGEITKEFTIVKPTVKKVKGVKATSKKSKTLTVKWRKSKDVKGYVIEYSLKKNFKGKKTVYVTKQKTVQKLIKKLKSGKKYYVRVAAYKNYKNAKGKTLKAIGKFTKVKKAVTVK